MRSESRASLAGIALALRALARLIGRTVRAGEIVFARGEKPRLATATVHRLLASGEAPATLARSLRPRGDIAVVDIAVDDIAVDDIAVDFSISHAGPWVACAALARGCVGFDLEMGTDARIAEWVAREAALKAGGEGLRALKEVEDLHVREGRMHWRGGVWHVRRLEGFEDASACVVSSIEVDAVETHPVELAELFDS
ncbi:MAG TPA: hypothetical protein VGH75_00850 [Steroidobacteraceae bacterium]